MTDFLIYGQLMPAADRDMPLPSTSDASPETLHILAGRILSHPPQPAVRAPRPDDPTPRRPPALVGGATKRKGPDPDAALSTTLGKRAKSIVEEDEQVRRAREVMLHGPKVAGLKRSKSSKAADSFKVPQLPARAGSMDSLSFESSRDLFAAADAGGKGKGKEVAEQPGSSELEKANKTVDSSFVRLFEYVAETPLQVIKQATIAALSKYGITKPHADFTELYQTTYRGVCFALVCAQPFQEDVCSTLSHDRDLSCAYRRQTCGLWTGLYRTTCACTSEAMGITIPDNMMPCGLSSPGLFTMCITIQYMARLLIALPFSVEPSGNTRLSP